MTYSTREGPSSTLTIYKQAPMMGSKGSKALGLDGAIQPTTSNSLFHTTPVQVHNATMQEFY